MNQNEPQRQAIRLMRTSRNGTLATVSNGQPFASLVTPASAPDRSLLMLLSGLSPHTRHLRQEQRCSIMLMGAPTDHNPQTAPRISLTGSAAPEPQPDLKARWIAVHPYAAFYADLVDFQLWRFRADAGQFVGGFASAHRFGADELAPDPAAVATIQAVEPRILSDYNSDGVHALDAIAEANGGTEAGWQIVAVDVDGCDLARNDLVLRIAWAEPAGSADAVRAALVRLADAARNSVALPSGPGV